MSLAPRLSSRLICAQLSRKVFSNYTNFCRETKPLPNYLRATVTMAEEAPGQPPSKNALKKAAKEKEKAEKAAKRKAEEEKQRQEAAADDVSANDYGDFPKDGLPPSPLWYGEQRASLKEIAEKYKDASIAEDADGPNVVFRAVVENARGQSAKLAFLVLGNRGSNIQAVVAASETLSRQMVKFAKDIPVQSHVLVHGLVRKPKEYVTSTTLGFLEIHVKRIYVISRVETLPIQVEDCRRPPPEEAVEETLKADGVDAITEKVGSLGKEAQKDAAGPIVSLNTRFQYRTIDLKTDVNDAIFEIKAGVSRLFQEFLWTKNFKQIFTPKISGASGEGGSDVFELKYFDRKATLSQSPQLYKQMSIASGFERVYEVGSVFRAENSNTTRHLTEFMGLDLEMVIEQEYTEVVDLVEELLLYIFNGLRQRYSHATETVRKTYPSEDFKLPEVGKTPRLKFWEGVQMLREAGVEMDDFDDLSTTAEKLLGKLVREKYGSDFYILDQYPLAVRPFYTMPSTKQGYSNSYDFHMRGVEILSGAQRIHNAELLTERMRAKDPPLSPDTPGNKEYVDSFRYGCLPHGGAGMGLERITMLWLGLPNVKLASQYPRDPSRLVP